MELSRTYAYLGNVYLHQKHEAIALNYYKKGLKSSQNTHNLNSQAYCMTKLGEFYLAKKNYSNPLSATSISALNTSPFLRTPPWYLLLRPRSLSASSSPKVDPVSARTFANSIGLSSLSLSSRRLNSSIESELSLRYSDRLSSRSSNVSVVRPIKSVPVDSAPQVAVAASRVSSPSLTLPRSVCFLS